MDIRTFSGGWMDALVTYLATKSDTDLHVPKHRIAPFVLGRPSKETKANNVVSLDVDDGSYIRYGYYVMAQHKGYPTGLNTTGPSEIEVIKDTLLLDSTTTDGGLHLDQIFDDQVNFLDFDEDGDNTENDRVQPWNIVVDVATGDEYKVLVVEDEHLLQTDVKGVFSVAGVNYRVYSTKVRKWYDKPMRYGMSVAVFSNNHNDATNLAQAIQDFFYLPTQGRDTIKSHGYLVDEIGDVLVTDFLEESAVTNRRDMTIVFGGQEMICEDVDPIYEVDLTSTAISPTGSNISEVILTMTNKFFSN